MYTTSRCTIESTLATESRNQRDTQRECTVAILLKINMREKNIHRSDSNLCVSRDPCGDLNYEEHGEDFLIVGEVSMVEHVESQFNEWFFVKPTHITSWLDDSEGEGYSLKRTISGDIF